jgi:hypothetical protein
MGLETLATVEIRERFHKDDRPVPSFYWQHGTMWIDTDDTDDLRVIQEVMEDEVLAPGLKVAFNLLKATETEPWDQWSMDIVGEARA